MRVLGLTGGIASGKSTVRAMLTALGAEVVDADALYHQLIEPRGQIPSELARRIEAAFPGVLTSTGHIDRRELGARIFADKNAREQLDRLTHPEVARAAAECFGRLASAGICVAVYEVPLLFERDLQRVIPEILLVWVPSDVQLRRLMSRDGLSEQEARLRLAAQLPLDEKRARATWVIDNSGSPEQTKKQVETLWRRVAGPGSGR